MDIDGWLAGLGLEEYAAAFAENRVTPDLLPDLTDQDLRDMGVAALGDRKRLLAAASALAAPQASAPTSRDGERRQVTVLFADIAGFTALSERLGAEAIHDLLNRYFAEADRIIEEFGGSIDKHIGDNVMAVFGAPVAHDNDPERAVRAALAIHEAVRGIETPEGPLALHIGIASGQVVASGTGSDSHREYTVTGDTVNLASRLEGLAGAGQTLISQAVHQRVAGLVAARPLGPQELKGIARPVPVWRVDRIDEAPGPRATPFVGRRAELGQCRAILAEVAAAGQGQAILVRGPAGIGKTRLTEEVLQGAREAGFAIHRALVLDFGSQKGQGAIPALVRSLLGLPATTAKEDREHAADLAFADGAYAAAERVFLNDLLDLPQPLELRRDYDAMDNVTRSAGRRSVVASLALWAARTAPQLILVEDLHWADAPTLNCLSELMAAAADSRVALMATSRPEGDPMEGRWRALSQQQPISIINLGPLRTREAQEMALAFAQASEERLTECLERAAGNPLFLEQLLQNVAESASESAQAAAAVPGSIQSLVLARMDRLDPLDKRALQAASVFGQRFTVPALASLIGRQDYDCAELLRHQLVRPEGEGLLFTHALVRDGVYESILDADRARLHLQAAEWFRDLDPALCAEHLDLAGDAAAPRAYLDAARAEIAKYRNYRALALLERGQTLARAPEERVEIALALGGAQHDVGALAEARAAFERALEHADNDTARCRAWLGLAGVKRITEDVAGALADLEAAQAAAERTGLTSEASRAHYLRGNLLFPSGDIDGCRQAHQTALDLARQAGDAELEAAALGGLADAEYLRGRYRSAAKLFLDCVEMSRANGFGRIEVANLPMIGVTCEWIGEVDRALSSGLEALDSAERIANPRARLIALDNLHFMYRARGDMKRARDYGDQALDLARDLGAGRFEAELLGFTGYLDHVEGKHETAIEKARAGVRLLRKIDSGMAFMGPTLLGLLMLSTDDPDERRQALVEAERLLASGAVSHNHCYFRIFAMDACLAAGDFDGMEHHANALAEFLPEPGLRLLEFLADRGRALARAGRGETSAALAAEIERLIEDGARMHQHLPLVALEKALEAISAASEVKPDGQRSSMRPST